MTSTLPDTVLLDDLAPMIELYREAGSKIAEWTEIRDKVRAAIEQRMGEHETGTVAGQPVVRWVHVTSNRVDTTLLKANHPDVYRACVTPQTSRRFTVVQP